MPSYTRPPGSENSQWEDFREETGGSDNRTDFQNWLVTQQLQGRYDDLSNFQSPYYQQFRSYLSQVTPTQGTNQVLAQQVAGGSNYATGSIIAAERDKSFQRNREDFLNKTVAGFAFQSQGQADDILGGIVQNSQFQQNLELRRDELDANSPDFWDYALPVLGTIGGFALGGPAGAATGFSFGSGFSKGGASATPASNPYSPQNSPYWNN